MSYFVDAAGTFLTRADPAQCQIVPDKFTKVCRRFKEIHIASGRPARLAIKPIKAAIYKMQPKDITGKSRLALALGWDRIGLSRITITDFN